MREPNSIHDWLLSKGFIRIGFLLYGRVELVPRVSETGVSRSFERKTYTFDELNLQWVKEVSSGT